MEHSELDHAIQLVKAEYIKAANTHEPMYSAHEGFAILKEEVDELWEAVRMKQGSIERLDAMDEEAIQVAAMALRFIIDIIAKEKY